MDHPWHVLPAADTGRDMVQLRIHEAPSKPENSPDGWGGERRAGHQKRTLARRSGILSLARQTISAADTDAVAGTLMPPWLTEARAG